MTKAEASSSRWSRPRFPVPFVTTGTATDLALAFALLPLWWALGVDQVVWLPLGLLILLKRWLVERRLRIGRVALVLLLAFAASYLLSGWSNAGVLDYFDKGYDKYTYALGVVISYARNAVTYAAAGIFLLLAADCARREGERLRVLYGLGFMAFLAVVVGALPYLGLPVRFEAPVRSLLPDWLFDLSVFARMVERALATDTCLFDRTIPRSRSVFSYSTLYATSLAMIAPLQAYLARASRGGWRYFWLSAAALSLLGMALTTSRTAAAALVLAAGAIAAPWALYLFWTRREKRAPLVVAALAVLCAGAISLAVLPGALGALVRNVGSEGCEPTRGAIAQEQQGREDQKTTLGASQEERRGIVSSLLKARTGSLLSRLNVYEVTIEKWRKRPVLGWATQRNDDRLFLPLGSHSMYLGTLYQRGVVGLAALLALVGFAALRLVRAFRRSNDTSFRLFLGCAAVSFLAAGLAGVLDIFDIDATVQVLYWTLLGLIFGATAREGEREDG